MYGGVHHWMPEGISMKTAAELTALSLMAAALPIHFIVAKEPFDDPEFMRQHDPDKSRRKVMKTRNRPAKAKKDRRKAKLARQARENTRQSR